MLLLRVVMKRRTFLQSAIAAPAVLGLMDRPDTQEKNESAHAGVLTSMTSLERIGVQLYTVRNLLSNDYEGTIRMVADAGFDEVETVWDPERNPDDIRALFDEVGLVAPATHASINDLQDRLSDIIDAAKRIGHSYIVCPWLAADQRTIEKYGEHVVLFNEVGAACKEEGIQFAYHNHEFEFEPTESGVIPYDFILEETDPELVKMELDLYWIAYADRDSLEYFRRYPKRFPLCHVKDMGEDRSITDVGKGQIDFIRIFAESETAGLKHYIVEHDNPEDPFPSIQTSIAHLKSLSF